MYTRISRDMREGVAEERQEGVIRDFIKRQRWTEPIVHVSDTGLSGSRFATKPRLAYLALLGAVKAGLPVRVVVWSQHRLFRDPFDLGELFRLLAADESAHVQFFASDRGEITTRPGKRMMPRVQAAFDANHSEEISENRKLALAQLRELGRPHGGPRPFGWAWGLKPNPDPGRHRPVACLLLVPSERDLIQEAAGHLLGGGSAFELARDWNERKVPSANGNTGKWSGTVLVKMLQSPRHMGMLPHAQPSGKRTSRGVRKMVLVGVAKGDWEPTLDETTWRKLQALFAARAGRSRSGDRVTVLTGVLFCAKCNNSRAMKLTRWGGRNKSDVRRHCARREDGTACGGVSIDEAQAAAYIAHMLFRYVDRLRLVEVLRTLSGREGDSDLAGDLQRAVSSRDELKSQRDQFASLDTWIELVNEADLEIRRVGERMTRATAVSPLEPFLGRPGALRDSWGQMTVDQKRAMIHAAFAKVYVHPRIPGARSFDPERIQLVPRFGDTSGEAQD